MTDRPAALALVGVRAGYGSVEVLHGVDLTVGAGQVVALLGPNGAGKTTTLRVASGELPATAGQLRLAGRPVAGVRPDALARAGVCTIPEGRGVFPNLSVRENIRMGGYAATRTKLRLADLEAKAYERFPQLATHRSQPAGALSGGEQQMLSMARALTTDPAVLLLDELSMGLAPLVVRRLYEHVAGIAATGVSILLVEQFASMALAAANRAAVLVGGRVVLEGPPDAVRDQLSGAYLGR